MNGHDFYGNGNERVIFHYPVDAIINAFGSDLCPLRVVLRIARFKPTHPFIHSKHIPRAIISTYHPFCMEFQSRSQPKRIEKAPPVFYISSIFRSPSDHQWTVVWVLLGQLYHHLGHRSIISCHPYNIFYSTFPFSKFRNMGFNANLLMHRIFNTYNWNVQQQQWRCRCPEEESLSCVPYRVVSGGWWLPVREGGWGYMV